MIPEEKMVDLLCDIQLAQAVYNSDNQFSSNEKKDGLIEGVLKKHKVTQADLDSSLLWYADNIAYLSLTSLETYGGTIEAFTYPDEFAVLDGTASPSLGLSIGQQKRGTFGLSYRTKIGNDTLSDDYGYKLHLVYGAQAKPSEKTYSTLNDSPEAITFSWEFTTTPVAIDGILKPTSILTIDSTKTTTAKLAALEKILYGDAAVVARLPLPAEVITTLAA